MIFIISCPQFIHGCWMVHQQWIGLVQNWKKFPQFCWSCHLRSFQWGSSGCTEQNSGVKRKHTIMTGITATLLLWANVLDISPGKCQKRCKVCDKHELRHIKECARGKMKICDVAHVIESRVYSDQVTCIIVVQSQQYNAGPVGDLENQRWESDTRSYTKTALKKNLFNVGLACLPFEKKSFQWLTHPSAHENAIWTDRNVISICSEDQWFGEKNCFRPMVNADSWPSCNFLYVKNISVCTRQIWDWITIFA